MIRKALKKDAAAVAALADELWPGHPDGELKSEFEVSLEDDDTAVFLLLSGGEPAGFAQCSLRRDYVEGTESSPVGYLEGIYIKASFRHEGHARALLCACEEWAREKGCCEVASDCELHNTQSLAFHLACGFDEAYRIICFTKSLGAVRSKPSAGG